MHQGVKFLTAVGLVLLCTIPSGCATDKQKPIELSIFRGYQFNGCP